MKVVALAGGVGGAKLVDGLARNLPAQDLTVIVNTGDDFTHCGLRICPDLDTVCYTLAGRASPETGWGLDGESFRTFKALKALGGPDWFRLGDGDLGTHLARTERLASGEKLSAITQDFCCRWGVKIRVFPMTDDPVATQVLTRSSGELSFQEYFVHQHCEPEVKGFRFEGIEQSAPAEGVLEALAAADVIVICPSNPWVSIGPILAVPGIMEQVKKKPAVAVSPIIGGKAVKGPAAKMYAELGIIPSSLAVAIQYHEVIQGLVVDKIDQNQVEQISGWGIISCVTDTLMLTVDDRKRLARDVILFSGSLARRL